jgi:putative flavoprotein involved in K+ transport
LEHFETVIIGGGQAGLSVGYHLARRGRRFVILDANQRIGDAWRKRWDSLRLFTPARYDGLPGWPFPAPAWSFPTKDEMADYLDPGIVQLHSSEYRDPSQLREGGVLVVGAANSGAEIALEMSRTHQTWLSGRHPGQEPFRPGSRWDWLLLPIVWTVASRVLTVKTPPGRAVRHKFHARGATHVGLPLARVRPRDFAAAGMERVPRTAGARGGLPVLDDGRALEVANVIWCTGFMPDFAWIDLPVFAEDGGPVHDGGVAGSEPGLYFVGLVFLHALASSLVGGVGRDAEHIAERIASRQPSDRPTEHVLAGARRPEAPEPTRIAEAGS